MTPLQPPSARSENSVEGTAFHASLPEGRQSVNLLVTESGCSFTIAPQSTLNFSWRGITIEKGGANNRLFFISHPTHPGWSVAVGDPYFKKLLHRLRHDEVVDALHSARRSGRRSFAITITVLLCLLGLGVGAYWTKEPLVRLISSSVPRSWEEQAGEKLFALHRASGKIIDTPEVKQTLEAFVAPLLVELNKTGYNPKVFVEQSDELNAFALPGGYVVLNSEVLKRADTPEEVLGVLAHEFAHVSERHVLRGLISTVGIYLGLSIVIGDYAGSLAAIGNALPQLINLGFSRDYEREADRVGFDFLTRAKINPKGMVEFFKKIQAEEARQLGAISDVTAGLSFLSTHPTTDERIKTLEGKLSGERNSYITLNDQFTALKHAVDKSNAP